MDFHFDKKLWEGNEIYYETVGFRYDKEGNIHAGQLLYEPEKILGVYSWDWQTPYVEGKDYKVEGRRFIWLPGSDIPVYPYDRNLPVNEPGKEPGYFVTWFDPERSVSIDEQGYEFQAAVVYTHRGKWQGKVPECQREYLPRTMKKLTEGGEFNLVFFGDSISMGAEASGLDEDIIIAFREEGGFRQKEFNWKIGREPNLPAWPRLFANSLGRAFPKAKINHINRSAPGQNTEWALWACEDTVNTRKPDLCVIAFGMNQADGKAEDFIADIRTIMGMISAKNPECEFILMSTHEPNRDAAVYKNHVLMEQEEGLWTLRGPHVAVAPVHSTFRTLYDMGKTYADLTGNNINHPNDFSILLYAQILDAVMGL